MEEIKITPNLMQAIEKILAKGNTAEVKLRKHDIIVLECVRHIEENEPYKGDK